MVHVQVELVCDGKQSTNSSRFRHRRVYVIRVKIETFGLAETQDTAAGFEFVDAAIAADFYLEYQFCGNDLSALRNGAHFESVLVN